MVIRPPRQWHTRRLTSVFAQIDYVLFLQALLAGTRRFTEIRRGIGGVNLKPLTESLRMLEHQT